VPYVWSLVCAHSGVPWQGWARDCMPVVYPPTQCYFERKRHPLEDTSFSSGNGNGNVIWNPVWNLRSLVLPSGRLHLAPAYDWVRTVHIPRRCIPECV